MHKKDDFGLTNDLKTILKYTVEMFIEDGTPVSSQALIENFKLNFSSAKVRYLMNDLEKFGFLEKTHTSSGRVPSAKGYEYYAMYLANFDTNAFKERLKDIFARRRVSIENTVEEAAKIITESIGVTLVTTENNEDATLKNLQLVPLSDREGLVLITDSYNKTTTNNITINKDVYSMNDLSIVTKVFNQRLVNSSLINLASSAKALWPILSESIKNYETLLEEYVNQVFHFAFVNKNNIYGRNNIILADEISRQDLLKILHKIENESIWEIIDSEIPDKNRNIKIAICSDHSTFIAKKLQNNKIKEISLVGTNRMNYAKGISALEILEELINEFDE
ncbi:heat-inducible transcriptional repressor HrcA [Mycoplasmopsis bovis]|uniref:heat-inducible transcriptional repressor HrcA n=1 Tax=Mycoplasmopsis bovis TaxID=28903 RepID=UPI001CF5F1E5|nr:heat-inducible transcriptional repressor HrcA [Mycoplasmopsis bovis]MCA8850444.1 heat-inducible transcriptional repressor HrcA [Mycoplasmopsis bovis]MCA8856702.1 heat-inducible transcriptional repressor HrcA [Mycoplasmopsis bovis]MCA8858240.1 heat-inducible transcriptional repressor HrcA [Mycoplasmopsis bovis]MCA8861314.1 heat-inducible transcriptional repressor HrcA [Mycoplasmopsis bovis]UCP04899.1 heat-inducible transcriptional repressor HrcA [Mycoplasmopsis bovis]